ncbi:hypothetical protein EVAR_43923_1 [Eumeta japonica]|uniref:Uncharacterized protein n=1 Tax=Eumeta variegata TaxID=151549 RepID=A0A4C1WQD1_EUMVA|nr:hypothetical protein EVAR_43923_1 [Eumeta japonica]
MEKTEHGHGLSLVKLEYRRCSTLVLKIRLRRPQQQWGRVRLLYSETLVKTTIEANYVNKTIEFQSQFRFEGNASTNRPRNCSPNKLAVLFDISCVAIQLTEYNTFGGRSNRFSRYTTGFAYIEVT